ncbi:alkaline phosphatase family protein [Salinarchaeum sp. Harcht-Bsk1]|uniref:alkaline phosphatase family protein n=1 Tax=Salinarchaeum sp. Harcht-Bsk1 TaxID=1333523 RepID=UPI000677C0C9|nr:alkaline phosphatase family protein [Salinarchaeum sp. Harcht-Bsk1]
MYETDASAALLERCRRDEIVHPDYGGYCIEGVPGTAAGVLGVDVGQPDPSGVSDVSASLPAETLGGAVGASSPAEAHSDVSHPDLSQVVVLVIDGLGWHRFHRDASDRRFVGRFLERGSVTPLTSVLPSSTGAAIPTLHTGAPPAEHGVLGWDVRLPEHDAIVEAFPHAVRDGVEETTPPIPPSGVVRSEPIYPALEAADVETRVVQPAGTLGTAYANATFRGATQVPYDGIEDGAEVLRSVLESSAGPSYTYVYVPDVDAVSHTSGSDSAAYHEVLETVCSALARALYDDLDAATARETLLLVTADHGFVDFDPGPEGCLDPTTIQAVADALERRPNGDPVPPWGDYRVSHLAVRDGERATVRRTLEARGAIVFDDETVTDVELFGPAPSSAFQRRCGDLVCTHPERKIVHPAAERIVPKIGMHGGPTARELLVPFAAARVSRLRCENE